MSATAVTARSPFDAIGGEDAVRRLVARFYDLMDGDPAYQALRHLHAPDLAPMRRSLTGFLTAGSAARATGSTPIRADA